MASNLLSKSKIEKRGIKVKKAEEMDGSLKNGVKSSVWCSYFKNYKHLVP
jgi:hypothetical protein